MEERQETNDREGEKQDQEEETTKRNPAGREKKPALTRAVRIVISFSLSLFHFLSLSAPRIVASLS